MWGRAVYSNIKQSRAYAHYFLAIICEKSTIMSTTAVFLNNHSFAGCVLLVITDASVDTKPRGSKKTCIIGSDSGQPCIGSYCQKKKTKAVSLPSSTSSLPTGDGGIRHEVKVTKGIWLCCRDTKCWGSVLCVHESVSYPWWGRRSMEGQGWQLHGESYVSASNYHLH